MGNLIIRREDLKVVYATDKVENLCEDLKVAKKNFDGNTVLANSLMARINALKQADTIKDIIVQPAFHFHKLINKNIPRPRPPTGCRTACCVSLRPTSRIDILCRPDAVYAAFLRKILG